MTLEERLLAYMDEHDWTRLDGVQRHHVRAWPDGTYLCVQALLDFWVLIEGTLDARLIAVEKLRSSSARVNCIRESGSR